MDIREMQQALEELIFVGQAHKLGVLDELNKKPDTASGLAARMGFDTRVTDILLEALVEMEYLVKNKDVYEVPESVKGRLIDKSSDDYEGDFWQFLLYLIDPWKTLHHVLKTGEPDMNSYEKLSIDDFIRGMDSPWKKKLAPEIVDCCLSYAPGASVIADIGGAPGTMAKEFASRGLKTIIYDLPECAAVTSDDLSKIENIEVKTGDATESLPAGNYDITFLGNLCHGQSPEDNKKIISMCFSHLNKGGIIVIFDNVRNETFPAATLALHMITQSSRGDVYSRKEYFQWIEKAGFKDPQVESLSEGAWKLIIARKPA